VNNTGTKKGSVMK